MDFEVLNLCVLSVYSQNTGCIGAHYDVGYFQHISSVVLETNIVPDSAGLPYSLLHPLREVGKNKISGCPICFALGGETEVGDLLIDLDQHLQHLGPEGLGGDHQAGEAHRQKDQRATGTDAGIDPAVTPSGIKLMSLNLLTANETDPVVWRGPVIANVVKQFWSDVVWGEVDYMFVDMPPGTGDVPLTVFQSLPVDGIIVVTSPQDLVSMIVSKAVHMAEMMSIPVLGLIENYSWYQCPDCGARHAIFGESRLEEVARELGLPILARLPIDPALAAACDAGKVEGAERNYLEEVAAQLDR